MSNFYTVFYRVFFLIERKALLCHFCVVGGCLFSINAQAQFVKYQKPVGRVEAVGPVLAPEFSEGVTKKTLKSVQSKEAHISSSFYDHGDPTVYEQLMLEYINRARMDPGAEASRLGIDLNQDLDPGTIEDTEKPPLALNPLLMQSAGEHSEWMLANDIFSHTGVDDSTSGERMVAAGYVFSGSWSRGENISWAGTSGTVDPLAHAIDRHNSLFISSGHRKNLMKAAFDEVGLGIRFGIFDGWNASMATQNFALSASTPGPLALGVAYYDFNQNGFYDIDEGISGVSVSMSGGMYHTDTATAGGYALPVPAGGGVRTLNFQHGDQVLEKEESFASDTNTKVDLLPAYVAPQLNGPASPVAGQGNTYTFPRVFGAEGYRFFRETREPALSDSAENLSRVIDATSSAYSALSSLHDQGAYAYHFAHPGGASQESLIYDATFLVLENASLRFRSRLRTATSDQYAELWLSTNEGQSWQVLYSQAGSGSPGEGSFQTRTVDLSGFAGENVKVAFVYNFSSGSYYTGTGSSTGWFVDEIEWINLQEVTILDTEDLAADAEVVFAPEAAGDQVWLRVAPLHGGALWPSGDSILVTAIAANAFHLWAVSQETALDLAPGTLAHNPRGDLNDDGTENGMAYQLGFDPNQDLQAVDLPNIAGGVFEYWTLNGSPFALVPQVSQNLSQWYDWDDPAFPGSVDVSFLHQSDGIDYYRLSPTFLPNDLLYMRLRLDLSP